MVSLSANPFAANNLSKPINFFASLIVFFFSGDQPSESLEEFALLGGQESCLSSQTSKRVQADRREMSISLK
jgi:hypothetical protein